MSRQLRQQFLDGDVKLAFAHEVVVRSYQEMYILFAASLIVLEVDIYPNSDRVLRLLCNATAEIDYALDSCAQLDERLLLERSILEFILDGTFANSNADISASRFFNDLNDLRNCMTMDTRLAVARITQRIFRRSECDRVTRSVTKIVASKIRQGRLTSELIIAAIRLESEPFRKVAILYGTAGSLLDSFRDSAHDFANGEVGAAPSFSLRIKYIYLLLIEISKIICLLGPISLTRIAVYSASVVIKVNRQGCKP